MFKHSIPTMHFIKPIWHWLTGLAPSLSALLSLYLFFVFPLKSPSLFSLASLSSSAISFSFSRHYLISPLSSLPLFFTLLCSWFSVLFMKSCSPRVCLNCILQKKKKKEAPQNPGSSQSQLNECHFLRLCLSAWFDGVICCFFCCWSGESCAISVLWHIYLLSM